jgi:hypothetical protein
MVRKFAAVLATVAAGISSSAFPQAPSSQANPASSVAGPMRFEWMREGPAEKCGNQCREWISASGAIVDSTVLDFEAFARQRDVRGAVIVLDSPGGNVVQGLALGREFRRLEVNTSVGKSIKAANGNGGEQRAIYSPRANCNSMCVFLLLGGIKRHVPDEARIYVHQIWPSSKRNDANAATYTAGNIAAIQRVNGEISRYIVDMGADIELFEVASRIPPWEEMRQLTRGELRRMKVHTTDDPFVRDAPVVVASVGAVPKPELSGAAATVNTLGWVVTDRSGRRALVRQHPITIEGKEIGAFEIVFTCSDKPQSYRVAYQERRIAPNSPPLATDRLEAVGISVRQINGALRTLLMLEESLPGKGPAELLSRAHGTVPASFLETAVAASSNEAVASSGQQGLVVATTTVDKVRTVIRLGQTGLPEGLRKLASSCDDTAPN